MESVKYRSINTDKDSIVPHPASTITSLAFPKKQGRPGWEAFSLWIAIQYRLVYIYHVFVHMY